jgi:hypothetical protein
MLREQKIIQQSHSVSVVSVNKKISMEDDRRNNAYTLRVLRSFSAFYVASLAISAADCDKRHPIHVCQRN